MRDKNSVTQGRHIRLTRFHNNDQEPLTVIETLRTEQEPLVLSADEVSSLLALLTLIDQPDAGNGEKYML